MEEKLGPNRENAKHTDAVRPRVPAADSITDYQYMVFRGAGLTSVPRSWRTRTARLSESAQLALDSDAPN